MAGIVDDIRTYQISEMTAEAVIRQLLGSVTVDMTIAVSTERQITAMNEVADAVYKLDDNISDEIKDISDNLKKMAEAMKILTNKRNLPGGPSGWAGGPEGSRGPKPAKQSRPARPNYPSGSSGGGSGGSGGGGSSGGGSGGSGGGSPRFNNRFPTSGVGSGLSGTTGAILAINAGLAKITSSFGKVASEMNISLTSALDGVVSDTIKWQANMAATRFSLEGIVGKNDDVKKQYNDIGSVTRETGMDRATYQTAYNKELMKGQVLEMKGGRLEKRSLDDQQRLLKNTLNTSYMIGTDAGQTVEMFGEWNRHLGLSNDQLSSVGRSMQTIAHTTGVSGDNLLAATKQATQLAKEVNKFSGITEKGMSNLIKQTALMQKYGFDETGGEVLKAVSGGAKTLMGSGKSAVIARGAARAGISQSELLSGNVGTDPKKTAQLFGGMIKDAQSIIKGFKGQGINLSGNIETLSDEIRMLPASQQALVKNTLENASVGVGELEKMNKFTIESGKTPQDRIAELQNKKNGLTGAGAGAARQTIDQQIAQITQSVNREIIGDFQSAMRVANGDTNKALATFNQGRDDKMGLDDIKKITGQNVNSLAGRAGKVGVDINKELKKAGVSSLKELQEGLTGANSDTMSKVLQDIENVVGVAEKGDQDPILKLQLAVKSINDNLKTLMEFFIGGIGLTAMVAIIAGMGASKLMSGAGMLSSGSKLLGLVPGLGGVGAAGAAVGGEAALGGTAALGTAAVGGEAALGGTAAASGAAAGGIGLGPLAVVAAALLGTVGALVGGFKAGAAAAQIFNVEEEKLTVRQKSAAEGAGLLTGALNFLTLGIFDETLGSMGTWTQSLAKFFDEFWILGSIFSAFLIPAKILWGALKGIWNFIIEVGDGIMDAVGEVWDSIVPVFDEIWGAVKEPIKELMDVFGMGGDVLAKDVSIIQNLADAGKWLGKAVGDAFRIIGHTVGWIIKEVAPLFVEGFKLIGEGIRKVTSVVKPLFNGFMEFFGGIGKILGGIFTLDSEKIKEGAGQLLEKAGPLLWEAASKTFGMIGDALKFVFISLPAKVGGWLLNIFSWENIKGAFTTLFVSLPTAIYDGITEKISSICDYFKDKFWAAVDWLISKIPGQQAASNAVAGATQTNEDFVATRKANGSSLGHAVGGGVDALGEIAKGNLLTGAGKGLSAAREGVQYVGKSVNSVMPWNWFDDGTRKIENDGLAVLHKGEAVIPSKYADQLIAQGNGSFNMVGQGSVSNASAKTEPMDLNKMFDKAYESQESKVGMGSLSKGMYLTESEDYSDFINRVFGYVSDVFNGDQVKGSSPKTKKGLASTNLFSSDEAETHISTQIEGSKPSGPMAMIPSMDKIFDYLNSTHTQKLDEMIKLLGEIRDGNNASTSFSSGNDDAEEDSGTKKYVKGRITGRWPMQNSSFSEMANNTGDIR